MGDHAAPSGFWARVRGFVSGVRARVAEAVPAVEWVISHRRKVGSAIVIALPFISRVVPSFPSADITAFVRMYFGA